MPEITTDHDAIRRWAGEHGARPAAIAATGSENDPGIIRLLLPGAPQPDDDLLDEISWREWFDAFEDNGLALVFERDGTFNELVARALAVDREEPLVEG